VSAWSWVLTAVGVLGLYLAGRKRWEGWLVGLSAQALWLAYAVSTRQYGFIVSAFAYGWVYGKNLRAWRREAADGHPRSGHRDVLDD
jgi:hypothetical protein